MQPNKPSEVSTPAWDALTWSAAGIGIAPPKRVVRVVTLAICLMTALALAYAYFTTLDVVVSGQGKVILTGKSKLVQPLEAGVVRAILVADGQRVKQGQVLIELDPTFTEADRVRVQRDLLDAELELARARGLLQGQARLMFTQATVVPPELAAAQLQQLQLRQAERASKLAGLEQDVAKRAADLGAVKASLVQQRAILPLINRKTEMREELHRVGHISDSGLIDAQLELKNVEKEVEILSSRLLESEASLKAAQEQRRQYDAEFRVRVGAELADAERKRAAATQELAKATQRRELQQLRAPADGIVQQLAITTVGGVVQAAQVLLSVAPEGEALEVEAQLLSKDIGQVSRGQRAIVKADSLDFTRYGHVEGEVIWVASDSVADQKLGSIYPLRVKLSNNSTPNAVNGKLGRLAPGMSTTVDVRVGERRLIEYFFAPVLRYQKEALREK